MLTCAAGLGSTPTRCPRRHVGERRSVSAPGRYPPSRAGGKGSAPDGSLTAGSPLRLRARPCPRGGARPAGATGTGQRFGHLQVFPKYWQRLLGEGPQVLVLAASCF